MSHALTFQVWEERPVADSILPTAFHSWLAFWFLMSFALKADYSAIVYRLPDYKLSQHHAKGSL